MRLLKYFEKQAEKEAKRQTVLKSANRLSWSTNHRNSTSRRLRDQLILLACSFESSDFEFLRANLGLKIQ